MRLRCRHGFFIFQETRSGQIADFMSWSGLELQSVDDYYTFPFIAEAPNYSLKTSPYLGIPATATFQGKPWEVFEENGFVYDFSKDLVVPIMTVLQKVTIKTAGNYFVSSGLILPGSLTDEGDRVTGYSAWFSMDRLTWRYSEVDYA